MLIVWYQTVAIQSVVIMLPTLTKEFSIPESSQQWVVSSYSLSFGCFLMLWGRIGDIYGKRLIFLIGSLWVCLITAVTTLARTEITFDILRALHGLVSHQPYVQKADPNIMQRVLQRMSQLRLEYWGALSRLEWQRTMRLALTVRKPVNLLRKMLTLLAAGAPLGGIFGNIVSGVIIQYASWKWVFGSFSIIAALLSCAGFVFIPKSPPPWQTSGPAQRPVIDWIGAALITSALIALTFALTEGNVVGWSTPWIPATIASSLAVIGIFIAWQLYLERRLEGGSNRPPLMKLSIFRSSRFSIVMVIAAFFFTAFSNYLIYATYYFQDYEGLSPIQTVLRFLPTGIIGVIMIAIVAQLLGRVPTVFILGFGTFCGSVACLLFAVPIEPSTNYFAWGFIAMILAVVGVDTTWPCLTLCTSQALPVEDQAMGGALINTIGQFGRVVGLAVVTSIQIAVMTQERGLAVPINEASRMRVGDIVTLHGIRSASWANFVYGIIGFAAVVLTFRNMDIIGKAQPTRREYDSNPDEDTP